MSDLHIINLGISYRVSATPNFDNNNLQSVYKLSFFHLLNINPLIFKMGEALGLNQCGNL